MSSKRIDPNLLTPFIGTRYPPPFDQPGRTLQRRRLGNPAGLTQFGVNLLLLPPGAWSSQRHWHSGPDELVYVLSGEVTLVTDAGEELLRAGDVAGFKAGDPDGHCLQNRSDADAQILEVGSRVAGDAVTYPDIDLQVVAGSEPGHFSHRDGTPYPPQHRSEPEA